ncbi:LLM class flavin-dependent oxidoreductase [Microbacterium rhizomatis]|uniref:LLM class flavin-dependent oxidoreductase n=1 Tax=Microbacterium rhizomatis TaxID=1631477 RepID=A0A5J5J1E0_9MICO|nr:LLM class flavin-dependent oxidoreductase [Microbacterium rhizomatis]KAA9106370.1 LLM class flavin-dependent oxidoreductase [Microbacterium rhizomatis]
MTAKRRVHLAAHFPGVNNTTIWSDPRAGSQIDFTSFEHFGRTAERGLFDFVFLAEGLRVREHAGRIHDLDVVGRPDSISVLAAVAAVTERVGLVATLNTTYNEPFELARQLLSLDVLSGGRAGWNVVTTNDAFTGANFRRGGYLGSADRYRRADDFVELARALWEHAGTRAESVHESDFFDVRARLDTPASPQGRPVILQAGVSAEGRDFAARYADAIFSPFATTGPAEEFYEDVKARVVAAGREPDDLKILPGATFVLGDTPSEADERYRYERSAQISGATALRTIEAVWGRELSDFDPDGPLPPLDLVVTGAQLAEGRATIHHDTRGVAEAWHERAEAEGLSIRQAVITKDARPPFVGTPGDIAARLDEFVQARGSDGFILVPTITPTGLDEFTEKVIPLLQERGVYPTEYADTTLRSHLLAPLPSA